MEENRRLGGVELVEELLRGSKSSIWRARHGRTGRELAVKILTSPAGGAGDRERFHREIRAHAGLTHPNVATVYGYGEVDAETADELGEGVLPGALYLITEYAPGGSIRTGLAIGGWEPLKELSFQLLDALSYAHARGVIHRDVKPGNILGFPDEGLLVKLSDFGLAHGPSDRRVTGREELSRPAGTMDYMAPEQLRGDWRSFGPWTDLYGLGCVLFELAGGRPPYPRERQREVALAHLEAEVPPLQPLFGVPDDFEGWLRRLLQKQPQARFRRAAEAAGALGRLADDLPGQSGRYVWIDDEVSRGGEVDADDKRTKELEAEEGMDLARPAEMPSAEGRVPPVDRQVPDLPVDWRPRPDRASRARRSPVGMSVFGLRELPLVGRIAERDAIWSTIREAIETSSARVILLDGPVGTETERLADWVQKRVDESGACAVLSTDYGGTAESERGLSDLLGQLFHAWRLSGDALRRHIRTFIERWHIEPVDVEDLEPVIERVAEVVGSSAEEGEAGVRRGRAQRPSEKYEMASRLLEQVARQRPVFLKLGAIDAAVESVDFLETLLETAARRPFPLFVLVTRANEARRADGSVVERVDRLVERPEVEAVSVEPLDEETHRTFVEELLPLVPEVRDEVVGRTRGRPVFSAELIRDWVDEGLLRETDRGFDLRADVDRSMPEDLRTLFDGRIERAVATLPEAARSGAEQLLELAAILGEPVDRREWELAAGEAGLEVDEAIFDRLAERGLVTYERMEWRFHHPLLVEALIDRSREAGRLGELSGAAADALGALYPRRVVEPARRRAEHLERAGRLEEATRAVDQAIEMAEQIGRIEIVRRLVDRQKRLFDRLDLPEESRRRIDLQMVASRVLFDEGNYEEARRLITRGVRIAGREGWQGVLARGLLLQAFLHRDGGEMEEAVDALDRARELFEIVGDGAGAAESLYKRGIVLERLGDYDAAETHYRRAAEMFEQEGETFEALNAGRWVVYPHIYRGEYEEARRLAEEYRDRARRFGARWVEAGCLNQLGEIARYQGHWREAKSSYQAFIELSRQMGRQDLSLARLNLALVDIGRHDYDGAAEILEELADKLADSGQQYVMPTVRMGQLCVALGRGEEWAGALEQLEAALATVGKQESDLGWLFERARREAGAEPGEALDALADQYGLRDESD